MKMRVLSLIHSLHGRHLHFILKEVRVELIYTGLLEDLHKLTVLLSFLFAENLLHLLLSDSLLHDALPQLFLVVLFVLILNLWTLHIQKLAGIELELLAQFFHEEIHLLLIVKVQLVHLSILEHATEGLRVVHLVSQLIELGAFPMKRLQWL